MKMAWHPMVKSMTQRVSLTSCTVKKSLMTIGRKQEALNMGTRTQLRLITVTKILCKKSLLKMNKQVRMRMSMSIEVILGFNMGSMAQMTVIKSKSPMRMRTHRPCLIDWQQVAILGQVTQVGLKGTVMCKMQLRLYR